MNLRDLKPRLLKRLGIECLNEYDEWFKRTGGEAWKETQDGKKVCVEMNPKEVWSTAYSRGAAAILRRVDALKEND